MIYSKAKTAVGKRVLEKREPQVHEGVKQALFMKATSTSEIVNLALKDLVIKKSQTNESIQRLILVMEKSIVCFEKTRRNTIHQKE